jgi:hypothetical protein
LKNGSGFFVTEDGYILTTKHTLVGIDDKLKKLEQALTEKGQQLKNYASALEEMFERMKTEEDWLTTTSSYLSEEREELKAMKLKLNRKTIASYNKRIQQFNARFMEYANKRTQYNGMRDLYSRKNGEYQQANEQFEKEYKAFTALKEKSNRQSEITIFIEDGTELIPSIAAVSDTFDLALLKIDGYRTPFLQPKDVYQVTQGETLFAIGYPLALGHTVTSGVFSGLKGKQIQTNAQINPGNSGGPLVTQDGKVIGINASKMIGKNIEGIGFAIPMSVAFKEFDFFLGYEHILH